MSKCKCDTNNEEVFYIDNKQVRSINKKILLRCDKRKCDKCNSLIDDINGCQHTTDIRHAKNFELYGDVFVEK